MKLDERQEMGRCIFREANDAFVVLRPRDLRILEVNPAAQRLSGRRKKDLLELRLQDLVRSDNERGLENLVQACKATTYYVPADTYGMITESGLVPISLSASRIHTDERTLALLVIRDVSRQRALEEQLLETHKMRAVGRLAGNVAHEFNNLLTIINGCATVLMDKIESSDPRREFAEEIAKAGERANRVTRQLLTFGRQDVAAPALVDVNAVLKDSRTMLRPVVGENVELSLQMSSEDLIVSIEEGAIEQILLNLALNACDAMSEGGKLTIACSPTVISDSTIVRHHGLPHGRYVLLKVSDTGAGMSATTQRKAFEPFFTTKEGDAGTGLGLSIVYSAVRRAGGEISVSSAPSHGTSFSIWLPEATEQALLGEEPPIEKRREASETILLVEDEDGVRRYVHDLLTDEGYKVVSAADGEEALSVVSSGQYALDVVLTDVGLPGLDGFELRERLAVELPGVPVLLMTGQMGFLREQQAESTLIEKPFTPSALRTALAELLESR